MNKFLWILALVVLLVIGLGAWYATSQQYAVIVEEAATPSVGPADTAALTAVAPYTGSGTATRSFASGVYTHTVAAALPDPAPGHFYEGWLERTTVGELQYFSTGRMTKSGNQYVLTFTDTRDYPDHPSVVITDETPANSAQGLPGAHVLRGLFGESR